MSDNSQVSIDFVADSLHNLKDVVLHFLKGTDVETNPFVRASINNDLWRGAVRGWVRR